MISRKPIGESPSRRFIIAEVSSPIPPQLPAQLQNLPWREFWLTSFNWIQKEPDFRKKEKFIADLLAQIPSRDLQAALLALRTLPASNERDDLSIRLLRTWTAQSPLRSLAWANALPDVGERYPAMESAIIVWANQNSENSLAWVRQIPDPAEREKMLSIIAGEIVRTDPQAAIRVAAALPVTKENDDLIRRATMDWAAVDSPAAIAWARQLPDDDGIKTKVLGGVALAAAETDPAGAANLALQTLPPGRLQDDAIIGILQRWAQQSPTLAAAWVNHFPEGALKLAAVENVAAVWSVSDNQAAREWKNHLPTAWQ